MKNNRSNKDWQVYRYESATTSMKNGNWKRKIMLSPYGDAPRDQDWILHGIDFYNTTYSGN